MIKNEVINEAISYIMEHITEEISVEDVAEHCHFSKFYFNRMFKEETGESVYAFIKRLKMEQSAFRLKVERQKSVTDICNDYGYTSSNYSSAFKQHHNMSPVDFRKSIAEKSIAGNPNGEIYNDMVAERVMSYEECDKHISIEVLDDFFVIYERYKGNYHDLKADWCAFMEKYQSYMTKDTILLESTYDDPTITHVDGCLYDICMTVDRSCTLENTRIMKGGRYVVYHFDGYLSLHYKEEFFMELDKIIIRGLTQNNLKNVSLDIPKGKLVVFTGVSGSGKSSIVFDTIAAESQRQIKETYPAFVRGKLPKYEKPRVDRIENLSASVIVDQSRLGGNARSTIGTITDLYAHLRLLFSRIGTPYVGTSSYFSFNNPNGMCMECGGLGKITQIDVESFIMPDKSWKEGLMDFTVFRPGSWYWKQYAQSGLFDLDKPWKDYSVQEKNLLLYGAYEKGSEQVHKKVEGIYNYLTRTLLNKDRSDSSETIQKRLEKLLKQEECPCCHGKRLNHTALECKVHGYSIAELCDMEFSELYEVIKTIDEASVSAIVDSMTATLARMIDIGLPYLNLNRETPTLSGGEAQRLKLVRYMGSSLTGMTYIFDEPSTGMHPRDVHRMSRLLTSLRDKGNTVLVVEHDKDIISIADEVIDVGPLAGKNGGDILFQGSYEQLLVSGTLTGNAMSEKIEVKEQPRKPVKFLPIREAKLHNLKGVSVDIPLGVLTVVTGVAGSGKSSLIREVFAKQYEDEVVLVDQSPISARERSTPATFLGFFDEIRKLMAEENKVDAAFFSFNSKGACPVCKGKGVIVTELAFMDPIVTECEACEGVRYSKEALMYCYQGRNIVEILDLPAEEACEFFKDNKKIRKYLKAMIEVGLPYLSLGQPLSTLSGGERQRIKLAKHLDKKGNIYILDEPTTGLHASDIKKVMSLLDSLVTRGNTVVVIEHNTDVMKLADYLIDVGPDGGTAGGEVVFTGTPQEMLEQSDSITARYLRKSV